MSVMRYVQKLKDSIRFMSKSDRRNLYHAFVGAASLTTAGTYVAFHTVLQDTTVMNLQMYRYKMALHVSSPMIDLLVETMEDFKLEFPKSDVGLFNFVGSDVYSIGSLTLPTGAYIGIPYNFNLDRKEQIKREDLRFLGQYRTKQPLNAPEMRNLLESLILSRKAKKYVIAHELYHLNSSYLYVKAFNILSLTMMSLLAVSNIRSSFNFRNRYTRMAAGVLGFVCIALSGWLFDELIDQTYDIRAMNQALTAADRHEDYAQGAIEYYEKMILRNQSLYKLLKQYGPSFYTEDGQSKRWLGGVLHKNYLSNLELANIYLKDMKTPKNTQVFRFNYK